MEDLKSVSDVFLSSKAVEELLSKSGAIGQDASRTIADAAMLEVASTNAPHMVTEPTESQQFTFSLTAAAE